MMINSNFYHNLRTMWHDTYYSKIYEDFNELYPCRKRNFNSNSEYKQKYHSTIVYNI
jgi:hypothetical protein